MKNTAKNNYADGAKNEMETVGSRLSIFLDKIGATRNDIAKDSGVVFSTVSNYLDKDELPGPKFLAHLVQKHRVNVDWLLSGRGPMTIEEIAQECRQLLVKNDKPLESEILDLRLELAKKDRELASYILVATKAAEVERRHRDKALTAIAMAAKAHGLASDQHLAMINAVLDPDRAIAEMESAQDTAQSHQQAVGD